MATDWKDGRGDRLERPPRQSKTGQSDSTHTLEHRPTKGTRKGTVGGTIEGITEGPIEGTIEGTVAGTVEGTIDGTKEARRQRWNNRRNRGWNPRAMGGSNIPHLKQSQGAAGRDRPCPPQVLGLSSADPGRLDQDHYLDDG